jgi:MoaA/NifB/PqqE/SkfB family radical SAM enzyme
MHLKSGMHLDMVEQDSIPLPKALELLDDLRDIGTKAITFTGGGEPLLHPSICEMMQRALDNALDISIITNGQLLTGKRAELLSQGKWVRVSIDYTNAESMRQSRNVALASFDGVMRNLESFAKIKGTCDLGINYIVTRDNYKELVPFARRLKDIGVNNIRFSPVYVKGFKEYHTPIAKEVEAQLVDCQRFCDDEFTINTTYDLNSPTKGYERPFTRCLYAQTVPVVGADCNIYTCKDHAYDKVGLVGSIKNKSFKEVWFSHETKAFFDNFKPCVSCLGIECAAHNKIAIYEQLVDTAMDNFV